MGIEDRDYFQEDRKRRLEKIEKNKNKLNDLFARKTPENNKEKTKQKDSENINEKPKRFERVSKSSEQQPPDLDAVLRSWIPSSKIIPYGLVALITFSITIYIVSLWPTSLGWAYKIALRFHYLLEALFFF